MSGMWTPGLQAPCGLERHAHWHAANLPVHLLCRLGERQRLAANASGRGFLTLALALHHGPSTLDGDVSSGTQRRAAVAEDVEADHVDFSARIAEEGR